MIALHKNKGKTVVACLKSRTDYVQNPDKTEQGELVVRLGDLREKRDLIS